MEMNTLTSISVLEQWWLAILIQTFKAPSRVVNFGYFDFSFFVISLSPRSFLRNLIDILAAETGTLLGAAVPENVEVAELLAEDFKIPYWRFTNSGSEATRAAIQVARGITGNDYIIKIECGYHGNIFFLKLVTS